MTKKRPVGPTIDTSLQVAGYVYDSATKYLELTDSEIDGAFNLSPTYNTKDGKRIIPMKKVLQMTGSGKETACEGCE